MSYATYITRAIVCGSRDSYTSDRSYLLFTETAGMLWATARSVREERSKQRYALQDFSVIRVSLVRGKSGWRIGSVESTENVFSKATTRQSRAGVAAVIKLLRRLLHGETVAPAVFADTMTALEYITAQSDTVSSTVDRYTLRVLAALGYIAPHESYQEVLTDPDWYKETEPLAGTASIAITKGLEASHL